MEILGNSTKIHIFVGEHYYALHVGMILELQKLLAI